MKNGHLFCNARYLLQFYALSAHAYTRGTWIASESSPIDRTKFATPFCTPAELTVPLLLKWALVWEHPQTQVLWFGRAIPRVWLSDGEHVRIINTTTGYCELQYKCRLLFDFSVENAERVENCP